MKHTLVRACVKAGALVEATDWAYIVVDAGQVFVADLGDGVCPFLSFTSIESDLLTLFQDDT